MNSELQKCLEEKQIIIEVLKEKIAYLEDILKEKDLKIDNLSKTLESVSKDFQQRLNDTVIELNKVEQENQRLIDIEAKNNRVLDRIKDIICKINIWDIIEPLKIRFECLKLANKIVQVLYK